MVNIIMIFYDIMDNDRLESEANIGIMFFENIDSFERASFTFQKFFFKKRS